jgi:CHAT domain-containing protein
MKLRLFLFFLLAFSSKFTIASNLNIISLNDLYEIRENHHIYNAPIDTLLLRKCINIGDKEVSKFAKGLLGLYYLENLDYKGEAYWLELGISDDKWFNDKQSLNEELYLFDDIFRVCVLYKKFYFFNNILNLFYDDKYDIFFQTYYLYSELKSGNIYNFLEIQNRYKQNFISGFSQEITNYDKKNLQNLLFNISLIKFTNFDTTNINFFNTLNNYCSNKLSDTNSFELILFNLSYRNYKNDTIIADQIARINNKKIISDKFIPAFILNYELENLPLLKEFKNYLLSYSSNNYNFVTDNYIRINEHLINILYKKINYVEKNLIASDLAEESFQKINNFEDNQVLFKTIFKCDSILNQSNIIDEPSFLYEFYEAILSIGEYNQSVATYIDQKYNNNASNSLYIGYNKIDSTYKHLDNFKYIDNINIFHSYKKLLSYVVLNNDDFIKNDTIINKMIDSVIHIINYMDMVNFYNSKNTYTNYNDKTLIQIQFQKYIILLKRILFIKQNYKLYEIVCKIDDNSFNGNKDERFPNEIYVASNKERYFAFKSIASAADFRLFDSLFLQTFEKELSIADTVLPFFKSIYYKPFFRDLILDIYNRGNIDEKTTVKAIGVNDILIHASKEFLINLNIESNFYGKDYLLKKYLNSTFCIDNKNLLINDTVLNDSIYLDIQNLVSSKKFNLDSNRKYLFYFIADNFEGLSANKYSIHDFETKKNMHLYAMYVNDQQVKIFNICNLDTLKLNFDFNSPKRKVFNSNLFFRNLDFNSNQLYNILLKPLEGYLDTNEIYHIVMPSSLNSIPLDYIFAKQTGQLINFKEFSSIYRAILINTNLYYNNTDSAALFSDFIYSDNYCGLDNSTNSETRGSISPLSYSINESDSISKNINSYLFQKQNGSKNNFVNTLIDGKYPIVHLITHGTYLPLNNYFNNSNSEKNNYNLPINPDERQLLLFSSDSLSKGLKNNMMTAYEVRYFENLSKINLLFLSACETGSAEVDDLENTGYGGFVNNFIEKGVKSVIATRWKVNDKYSVDFANKFYYNLAKFKNYNEAFFQTKKIFFLNNTAPYLWTSYIYVQ